MIIEYSYPPEFKLLFRRLKKWKNADELLELDGIGSQLDVAAFSKKFFSKRGKLTTADISVDSNSNVDTVNVLQYNIEVAKPLHRLNSYYLLWKYADELFSEEVATRLVEAQFSKELYINDFHGFNFPYCFNFSCMDVVCNGLPFVEKITCRKPEHLSSFMGQMVQFVTYCSNSIAGAVGLADLLICASYYVDQMLKEKEYTDKQIWKQVKQELQSFIFSVNQPSRNGQQSPFTNISIFDDLFLTKFCGEYVFPNGSHPKIEIVKELQNLYMDLVNRILSETPATFPITTACFSVDDNRNIQDMRFLDLVVEKDLPYGFMNIYSGKTSTLSSCCRLRSEANNEYHNMFGSGGTKIGSIGVVTLNLPRIAFTSKSKEEFFKKLEELVILVSQINQTKRTIIKKRIENGHLPLYSLGIMDITRQYSTVGLIGINEACEILGLDIKTEEGQKFVVKMLQKVNEVNDIQQKKFKTLHNCEQVPGESSAVVLATADKIYGHNTKYALYSNQFIPLTTEVDILDRIKLQGMFDSALSGGAICHLSFSERVTDADFLKKLLIKSISLGVIYQAINYNLQRCKNEHMTVGKTVRCQVCGEEIVDNFTRVVGFLINVKNWHKVRREVDYPKRQWY